MKQPILFQRLEALALLIFCVTAFGMLGGNWWVFFVCLLAPDLAAIGYLVDPRIGAFCYNLTHSAIAPLLIATASLIIPSNFCKLIAIIWLAHIGMDRALGYGLKHTSGFTDTHLGKIGKDGRH